ncbi:MurR/RpiR family transcriptional regulator [Clostridium sp. AL.422]|uniref:MurR/RpiR family transcriptional regulator n=1 Tax=Clostridium TaxID=1485 RepID=UPI00293DACB5|nr:MULTISPECIES: MurR/RpiR family transcriptional regulator [unclassified Clostridium]MDV4152035.1 MurR/RpiR family transcriptional regulator [Clostridium sp. AL.422]
MKDILNVIFSKLDILSDSHQEIAKVILRTPDKIPSYKITQLASEAGVSISTISKFCQVIDLEGFDELRFMLKYRSASENIDNKLLLTLSTTHSNVISKIDAVAKILNSKSKIYIFAKSNSANTAFDFYYKIRKIRSDIVFERNTSLINTTISNIDSGTVILVSNSANNHICNIAEKLHSNDKVKIISITNNNNNKLNRFSDICLTGIPFEIDPTIKQYLPFNSKYSIMYILDLVFYTYFQMNYNKNLDKLRESRLKVDEFF